MRLIVGLGNPGEKYAKNRHNIGFMILEKIVSKKLVDFRIDKKHQSMLAEIKSDLKLAKPQTFMNNSGQAVRSLKDFYKIEEKDIWVIYDDVDLEFGKVRINLGGSSAGHKGVESIIEAIGESFWRIRVGISRDEKIPTDDWVLMNFEKSQQEMLNKIIDLMADYVLESLDKGIKEQTIKATEGSDSWGHKDQS